MTIPDWNRAACRDADAAWFFPPDGRGNFDTSKARALCVRCDLLEQCRAYALERRVQGIWGGLTEKQRRQMQGEAAA